MTSKEELPSFPCASCLLDQAQRLAHHALVHATAAALKTLPSLLAHTRPQLDTLIADASNEARASHWEHAALLARNANDLLASAILANYTDESRPNVPNAVLMPLSAARAVQTMTNVTTALANVAMAKGTEAPALIRQATEAATLAINTPPRLLEQAPATPLLTCTHQPGDPT